MKITIAKNAYKKDHEELAPVLYLFSLNPVIVAAFIKDILLWQSPLILNVWNPPSTECSLEQIHALVEGSPSIFILISALSSFKYFSISSFPLKHILNNRVSPYSFFFYLYQLHDNQSI